RMRGDVRELDAGRQHRIDVSVTSERALHDAVQTIAHIANIGDLAHLPVADDVDPAFALPGNGLPHCGGTHARKGVRVDALTALVRREQRAQIVRPWQAAGMRGQDPLGAALLHVTMARALHCATPVTLADAALAMRVDAEAFLRHS